jgi:hypothetical protein
VGVSFQDAVKLLDYAASIIEEGNMVMQQWGDYNKRRKSKHSEKSLFPCKLVCHKLHRLA